MNSPQKNALSNATNITAGLDTTKLQTESNPITRNNQARNELPQFLRDLISSPPQHGSGVHQWLFKMSRQLHAHRDRQEIIHLLGAAVDGCGRNVPLSEIESAVDSAHSCAWEFGQNQSSTPKKPKWPALDEAKRAAIIAKGISLAGLTDASPLYCDPQVLDTDFFIEHLFPGDPLLCIGKTSQKFKTAPKSEFKNLSSMALIVPSSMSAITGRRQSDGIHSWHTLDNTGERQYLVTEFDSGTSDEQAALIQYLTGYARLTMVLSSGGKSLHAWWCCAGVNAENVSSFMRYAVSIGADPATWTRSQFVRIPQGWREDKAKLQQVYYFDYDAVLTGKAAQS